MAKHTVKQGECISSIAYKHGFFPDTIWNDSKNGKLKQDRKNPNVLFAGAIEQRHRFRRKDVKAKFKVTLLDSYNNPHTNELHRLEIDGKHITGIPNSKGALEVPIPCNVQRGVLYVGKLEEEERHDFQLEWIGSNHRNRWGAGPTRPGFYLENGCIWICT